MRMSLIPVLLVVGVLLVRAVLVVVVPNVRVLLVEHGGEHEVRFDETMNLANGACHCVEGMRDGKMWKWWECRVRRLSAQP